MSSFFLSPVFFCSKKEENGTFSIIVHVYRPVRTRNQNDTTSMSMLRMSILPTCKFYCAYVFNQYYM